MRTCENYEVKIWLGHRANYTSVYTHSGKVDKFIKDWCDEKKQAVSVTPTKFIYVNGEEPGTIVGFINYPRYPKEKEDILSRALELGELLRKEFNQYRVSVTTPETTYLLEDEEN